MSECGTRAGHATHLRDLTPVCDACKAARNAYYRQRRLRMGGPTITTRWREGYDDALRDIHAIVQDMPPVLGSYIQGFGTVLVARDRVLTAIETLRGQR